MVYQQQHNAHNKCHNYTTTLGQVLQLCPPLSTETTFDWQLIGINEMAMFSYSFLYFGQPGCCVPNVAGLVLPPYLILSYTMGKMLYAYICYMLLFL